MKIAYLYHRDAANVDVQSGRPASILRHLLAAGAEVQQVFPLQAKLARTATTKKILFRLIGKYYRGDRDPAYLAALAQEAQDQMAGKAFDVVFSPGSEVISALKSTAPITFCADATFANMVDYYWDFSRVSAGYRRKGHAQEAAALKRVSLAVYPSEWAARSAIEFYGTDPKRVATIPFGANLGSENQAEQVFEWVNERSPSCLRLLFVGRDWNRKGGEIVIEAAKRLTKQGLRVELDLVGGDVPHGYRDIPWITTHGVLSSNHPEARKTLGALFRRAHFMFLPSRAEAYGMAFAEASAFGVPVIAAATGGVPTIVHEGINGFLLPLGAGAEDYAALISTVFSNHGDYVRLARASFAEFEQRLNWRVFCQRYFEALTEKGIVDHPAPKPTELKNNENRLCR